MHELDFMDKDQIKIWTKRLNDFGAEQVIYELRQEDFTVDQISDFFRAINFYPDPESWQHEKI